MCISNIGNRRPYPAAAAVAGKYNAIDASFFARVAAKDGFRNQQIDLSAFEPKPLPTSAPIVKPPAQEPVAAAAKAQNAHIVVQHNYHDHSKDARSAYQEEHPARGGVTTPFPLKLHEMLDNVARDSKESIVSWQPHGRCFVVHKPKEFVELLPNYFKLSKLASFQRQLNLYGFQRLTRGRDRGGYYHELFLKGKVFLAHNIQRIKVKGTGVRARSNPDQEPDFWSMNWVAEGPAESDSDNSTVPPSHPDELSTLSRVVEKSVASLPLQLNPPVAMKNPPLFTEEPEVADVFGDKTFHYLDPFKQQPGEQRSKWSLQGVDELLSSEAESFFEDFDFPENIGSEIEDDNVFGDMLEQMIA